MKCSLTYKFIILFLFIFGFAKAQTKDNNHHKNEVVYDVNGFENGAFLHDFMMVGPFPNLLPEGVTEYFHLDATCLGFAKDYLASVGGEKNVAPYIGQKVTYDTGKELTWKKVHSVPDIVDLKKVFSPNDKVVAYAAIWIESDKDVEKLMGIGSNDGMKVWLNGEMLIKVHKPRTVTIDSEYLKLHLKKGRNLLLIKIEQGFGGWGFVLRPVDNQTAWKQVQKHLDVAMDSEFYLDGDIIKGVVGNNNVVGQLSDLPVAKVSFKAIDGSHSKTLNIAVGTHLALQKSDFPADEYAITITFDTDNGTFTSYAYMKTETDVVKETREWMYKDLPEAPESPMANYYQDFIETVRWLDQANKLWEHPYGYRRYLDGIKNAHKGTEKLQNSTNPFDGVFPAPRSMKFGEKSTTVNSDWKIYDLNQTADFIDEKLKNFWKKKFNKEVVYAKENGKKGIVSLELSDSKKIATPEGSYLLDIQKEKIIIKARSRQGLFYGVSTLLQALKQNRTIPRGVVNDYPEYPVRSVIITKTAIALTKEFKEYIEELADLRYNVAYIPLNISSDTDLPEYFETMRKIFAYCESRFIEPSAYFETFGAGTITRVLDSDLDEGVFHENESWTVSEKGLIELDVPRILDCQSSAIHIHTKDGRELKRFVDYKVLSSNNPKILIEDSKLFNTELLLSYDAVDFSGFPHPASCPSDPHGWEIMGNFISTVLAELKPKSIHISQDEAGFVNKDSRCLSRGLTNQEIMIDQINKVHSIIRKYDKNVAVYMWGDLFNDLQNAPEIGATGIVKGLPKDIAIHDWNYIAVYHSDKMKTINQMNFYFDRGYKTGGVAWFEPANVLDILLAGRKHKDLFIGIMHSEWARFGQSFFPVAEANWTGETILGNIKF